MNRMIAVVLVLCLLCILWTGSLIQAQHLPTVHSTTVARSFLGNPVPSWENGFLVGFEMQPSDAPVVYAYNRHGERLFEVGLRIPEATRVTISDVAASTAGTFAVSGGVVNASGQAGNFIAWLNAQGGILRLVRPELAGASYAALRLAFAPTGELWTAGRAVLFAGEEPPHDLLRMYDHDGKMVRSLLPRASFEGSKKIHPARGSFLTATQDGVCFYSVERGEMICYAKDGVLLSRIKAPLPTFDLQITGLTAVNSKGIYLSGQLAKNSRSVGELYRLNVSNGSGTWLLLHSDETQVSAIFGADQGDIVISERLPKFDWVRLP